MAIIDKLFTLPTGKKARINYLNMRDNDDFPEFGYCGQPNVSKSWGGVDFLLRRVIEYPGSTNIMARNTLKNLRDTTAKLLVQRAGKGFFDKANEMEVRYEREGIHPVTGEKVMSRVVGFGLDHISIEDIFRSWEVFSSFLEEGNTLDIKSHDAFLWRMRQVCFHIEKTVWDLSVKMAMRWNVSPEQAYEIMFADRSHNVGKLDLSIDHPMPGTIVQKTAWNPTDADELYQRYIGHEYPEPYPTPEWVNEHVGIKEVHVKGEEIIQDRTTLTAGTEVRIEGEEISRRYFVEYHYEKTQMVKLINVPKPVETERLYMVRKRYCIFGFTFENESRDRENALNMYLMQDQSFRKTVQRGELSDKADEKRVFTQYRDDPMELGGHVVTVTPQMIATAKYGLGGIDQGGDHPTVIIHSIFLPKLRGLLIYDEYVRSGYSAASSAQDAKMMVLPSMTNFMWGYDPAMDSKEYSRNTDYAIIDEYKDVLGSHNLVKSVSGDKAFDLVNRMFQIDLNYTNDFKPVARLYVSDRCERVRETLKGVKYKHIRHNRNNPMVDIADTIKYMVHALEVLIEQTKIDTSENAKDLMFGARAVFNPQFNMKFGNIDNSNRGEDVYLESYPIYIED